MFVRRMMLLIQVAARLVVVIRDEVVVENYVHFVVGLYVKYKANLQSKINKFDIEKWDLKMTPAYL